MCYINVVTVAQNICVCVKMVLRLHGTHIGKGKDRSIVIFAPAGTILSSCPILSNNTCIFPNRRNLSYCTTAVTTGHPVPSGAAELVSYLGTVPTAPGASATIPTAITPAASTATSAVSSATSALSATSPTAPSTSSQHLQQHPFLLSITSLAASVTSAISTSVPASLTLPSQSSSVSASALVALSSSSTLLSGSITAQQATEQFAVTWIGSNIHSSSLRILLGTTLHHLHLPTSLLLLNIFPKDPTATHNYRVE